VTPLEIGFASVVAVLVLIALRVPIGVVLGLVSIVGIAALRNMDVAYGMLETAPFEFAAHWSLSAIPMFLLMGAFAFHSGITADLFRAARLWFGRLPGGLAVATNFACAGFSAASGSSLATAAAMGRITIPEMIGRGYDKALSTGVVASAGTLGSLIPPSIIMILYGIFAEVSIRELFIAGVVPGLLTALLYGAMIVIRCKITPSLAPRVVEKVSWGERFRSLRNVWPLLALIVGIIAALYGGVVTTTEAGAFGAFLAFLILLVLGRMSVKVFRDSVLDALSATARIFFIAVGAVLYTRFLAMTGMPAFLGNMVGDWAADPLLLVLASSLIYLVLGMFLNPTGLLLLTLPLLLPMYQALDINLIWLGILVVKFLEIGLITPPVGLNVYIIKSVVGNTVELETIFKGVLWFLLCDLIVVALLVVFPGIALYLPSLMR
jgi:C4-dicarboxylate transporter, DctM subunit